MPPPRRTGQEKARRPRSASRRTALPANCAPNDRSSSSRIMQQRRAIRAYLSSSVV